MTIPMMRRRQIEVDGWVIQLTRAEAHLAACLLALRPRPIKARDLADVVYADDPDGGPLHKTLDVQLFKMRAKGVPVVHRPGFGYSL